MSIGRASAITIHRTMYSAPECPKPIVANYIFIHQDQRGLNDLLKTRIFSVSYDLAPPHPSPQSRQQVFTLSQSSCVSPDELTDRGGGGGRIKSLIIRGQEVLVLYITFNTLKVHFVTFFRTTFKVVFAWKGIGNGFACWEAGARQDAEEGGRLHQQVPGEHKIRWKQWPQNLFAY
jgi:hypothetical protein